MHKKYKISELPKFIHVSNEESINLIQAYQSNDSFKPRGLYYAQRVEWLQFMEDGMGLTDDVKNTDTHVFTSDTVYLFEVVIPEHLRIKLSDIPNHKRILFIDSVMDVKKFIDKYHYKTCEIGMRYVNWKKVGDEYGGIEFANYHENISEIYHENISEMMKDWQRHQYSDDFCLYMLYSSFDVNGGCLWNVPDIKVIPIYPELI